MEWKGIPDDPAKWADNQGGNEGKRGALSASSRESRFRGAGVMGWWEEEGTGASIGSQRSMNVLIGNKRPCEVLSKMNMVIKDRIWHWQERYIGVEKALSQGHQRGSRCHSGLGQWWWDQNGYTQRPTGLVGTNRNFLSNLMSRNGWETGGRSQNDSQGNVRMENSRPLVCSLRCVLSVARCHPAARKMPPPGQLLPSGCPVCTLKLLKSVVSGNQISYFSTWLCFF